MAMAMVIQRAERKEKTNRSLSIVSFKLLHSDWNWKPCDKKMAYINEQREGTEQQSLFVNFVLIQRSCTQMAAANNTGRLGNVHTELL